MRTAVLERMIGRGGRPGAGVVDTCALCAEPLPADHPHLLDVDGREPRCVCRSCGLLFDAPAAARGRYRRIPDRRRRLDGLETADLGVPVGLAFFVVDDDGAVTANYPGPAGATRSEVDEAGWRAAVGREPELGRLVPAVEALLVNTTRGRREAWVVPVSDAYRLVGLIRQHWRGLSGGPRVGPEIEGFFDELRRSHGQDPGR